MIGSHQLVYNRFSHYLLNCQIAVSFVRASSPANVRIVARWQTDNVAESQCHDQTSLQWTEGAGPPSFTLRSVSASGTAASEISISIQNASM
jgi:hypothetical protein